MRTPPITAEMFPGLLGILKTAAEACSEAHPAAIGSQFLVGFGNAVGRGPHVYVGETRHGVQEFCLNVGDTATGRKGDAWNVARAPLAAADPTWADDCVRSGLSSGEGLIHHVRDEVRGSDRKTGEPVVLDAGVADKRLLVVETEFSQPLKMFRREGNVLSNVLRDAWDGKRMLATLTKTAPTHATEAHISVNGHTTPEDLRTYLADLDVANGLANRFLIVAVERTRLLASPPRMPEDVRTDLAAQIAATLRHAGSVGRLQRTAAAEGLWRGVYRALTIAPPGLHGALLARGPAHVFRLSALFALLAQTAAIDVPHLTAALAWWDYVSASVEIIFSDRTGNAEADRIRTEMLPGEALDLRTLRERLFSNHVSSGRLHDALELLQRLGNIRITTQQTGGRPRIVVERVGTDNGAEKTGLVAVGEAAP